jgi:hypothetical protein
VTFTYDLATDVGRVRLMVPDRTDDPDPIFQDEEIQAFLAVEGDVKLAAALALETIASNEVYTLKAIKAGTVALDGPGTAEGILKRAALLRYQIAYPDSGDGVYFDVAEWVTGPFSQRERLMNQALREGG